MPAMTDPMNALVQLQSALDSRIVRLQACDIHKDVSIIADRPNGIPRYTYAKVAVARCSPYPYLCLLNRLTRFCVFRWDGRPLKQCVPWIRNRDNDQGSRRASKWAEKKRG